MIVDDNHSGQVFLVACAARKLGHAASARDLYVSELFKQSRNLASRIGESWFILSAKHGLLRPDQMVSPYEQTLNEMPEGARIKWGKHVFKSIKEEVGNPVEIVMLAGKHYAKPLESALKSVGHSFWRPLAHLSIGRQIQWLQRSNADIQRWLNVRSLYVELAKLASNKNQFTALANMDGRSLPKRGIYFFFDPAETTPFHDSVPRLVRIGTHAVSAGSKSTLWQRLRTHRGGSDLSGNHRGSIFRLHVGAAQISAGRAVCSSWGAGQSAGAEIRVKETQAEKWVSQYIGKLLVAYLDVSDAVGPDSDRAYIEQNTVGLMSTPMPLDPIAPTWLGLQSHRHAINKSGLWNVNYIGDGYHPELLSIIKHYVERTIKPIENFEESIAPKGWRMAKRSPKSKTPQLELEI